MIPRRLLTYALLVAGVCGMSASASTQDEIRKRQEELQSLRNQVRELDHAIKEQQKNEQTTLELLDSYDKKATVVRKLISGLRAEERRLQVNILTTQRTLDTLEHQLQFLKTHYARYVASAYKAGRAHDIELLLSSNSINQFYVRTEYLRRFTDQRRRDAEKITVKRSEIEEIQAQLQHQLTEERRLIAEKGAEEDRLVSLVTDRKTVLVRIRKDKKSVERQRERKLQAARELESMIANLIEMERLRKEKEAGEAKLGALPQPPPIAGGFEKKKGRLRWPVSEGTIAARFGNQVHPTLKTVTQNTGIDIIVKPGSVVGTVAEGKVSKITWLPSYGNLVIMDHGDGYFTVYTHLSEIGVLEGQVLKEGEAIGLSGETIDGPRLHFEVYKGRDKQNPEHWLSRR